MKWKNSISVLLLFTFNSSLFAQKESNSFRILSNDEVESIMNSLPDSIPRYFDSHIHSTNMVYYKYIPTPSSLLNAKYSKDNIQYWNWEKGERLHTDFKKGNSAKNYGMADYGRINESGASILFTSITPIEKRFTDRPMKRLLTSKFVTMYSLKRIRVTNKISSFSEFQGELKFLQSQAKKYNDSRIIKPVLNKSELIENLKKGNISLITTLEGGHTLEGDGVSKLKLKHTKLFDEKSKEDILKNIDYLKSNPNNRVLFITLAHFAWNGIAGFCKTLDENDVKIRGLLKLFSKSEKFRIWIFAKSSDGLTEYTYEQPKKNISTCCDYRDTIRNKSGIIFTDFPEQVINKLLDTSKGQLPIYIDVKHMDIKARFQYYDYLKRNKIKVPIIFSHGAVNGKSRRLSEYTGLYPTFDLYDEVDIVHLKNYINKHQKCFDSLNLTYNIEDTLGWFYPWSINLCNEEIPIIYKSDGIIGLTLDERILGCKRPNYQDESYLAKLKLFMRESYSKNFSIDTFISMQPLFRNIFYLVENSNFPEMPTQDAWKHLTIGSDFDGFILPVDFCRTAADIPNLRNLLIKYLPLYEDFIYSNPKYKTNSNFPNHKILFNLTPTEIANNIIYKNGERFTLKYF